MGIVFNLFVAAHLLGMATLVGGWIAIRLGASTISMVVWGARLQLITGLLLVGLAEMDAAGDDKLNHVKIGVKLVVAIAVVACAEISNGRAKRGAPAPRLLDAAGGLALLNVLVATLWT